MRFLVKKPVKIFDQIQKYGAITNLLGIGDPHVVKIQNQWVMFVGGFQTNFKNNIFTATLPIGESLSSNNWAITTQEDNPTKAKPLAKNSKKGSWDYFGFHTPCYVSGKGVDGKPLERVYYTGRASKTVLDNKEPYSIGVFEKTKKGWKRYPSPVFKGTSESPNVLEPKARYIDGKWRLWYVTTKQETGKKGYPKYCIKYVESENGINNWSEPVSLFSEEENFYDASVHYSNSQGFEMAVCRSTNLYGRKPFPKQGLWLLEGAKPNGNRENWSSSPLQIVDCDKGEEWYKNGIASPSAHYGEHEEDKNSLYMFFTGLHQQRNWIHIALDRVRKGKIPPFPSPFYFTIGRIELIKKRND